MKISTKKTLFLIGGIVMLVQLFSSILLYLVLINSPNLYTYIASFYNFNYSHTIFVFVFTIFEIINAILALIASIIFFRKSKYGDEEFESKKNSNLIWSVVVLLFIGFIPGILGVIASVISSDEQKTQNANVEQKAQTVDAKQINTSESSVSNVSTDLSELQAKIVKLKKLKESGNITEEEYEKLFSSLIINK